MSRFAFENVQNSRRRGHGCAARAQRQFERMRGDARREHFTKQIRHKAGSAQRRRHDRNVHQMRKRKYIFGRRAAYVIIITRPRAIPSGPVCTGGAVRQMDGRVQVGGQRSPDVRSLLRV